MLSYLRAYVRGRRTQLAAVAHMRYDRPMTHARRLATHATQLLTHDVTTPDMWRRVVVPTWLNAMGLVATFCVLAADRVFSLGIVL